MKPHLFFFSLLFFLLAATTPFASLQTEDFSRIHVGAKNLILPDFIGTKTPESRSTCRVWTVYLRKHTSDPGVPSENGMNWTGYVGGDPVNMVDPSGYVEDFLTRIELRLHEKYDKRNCRCVRYKEPDWRGRLALELANEADEIEISLTDFHSSASLPGVHSHQFLYKNGEVIGALGYAVSIPIMVSDFRQTPINGVAKFYAENRTILHTQKNPSKFVSNMINLSGTEGTICWMGSCSGFIDTAPDCLEWKCENPKDNVCVNK